MDGYNLGRMGLDLVWSGNWICSNSCCFITVDIETRDNDANNMPRVLDPFRFVLIAVAGNLYIADSRNLRVRKVDLNGIITTFAGNGASTASGNGDGGPAVNASFGTVSDVAFDANGNLYVPDVSVNFTGAIRRVSPDGTITTLTAALNGAVGAVAVDAVGNIYTSVFDPIARPGTGGTVFRISTDGTTISAVTAYTGTAGKIAFDSRGNFYMGGNSTVSQVTPSGAQAVVAGTGLTGFSGDDGPATAAQLNSPEGVALDSAGNLYIADSGNNRIRKVFLNPVSGVSQPTLQTTLQPGYYTATVTLGQGQQPGYWGMQVLAPVGVLAGGFNLGGMIQQRSQPPGFGGIYLPGPQPVHLHVDTQAADGSSSSTVGLGVQILDASNNPVSAEQFGGTSLDFTQPLTAGYYTIVVRGGVNSPNENFQMALGATQFTGGVVVGGYAAPDSTGFGGFYLSAQQQVTIQVLGQPTYGAVGAGGLRLTLYDSNRNVIVAVP